MKSIDIKSITIGVLLTSTIFLGAATPSEPSPYVPEGAIKNVWPFFLAIVLVGGQILYVRKGPAFDWPDIFRCLGTLSFAAVALIIAILLAEEAKIDRREKLQVIALLLPPFISFVSCYLIAHILETFNMIRENTGTLVRVACAKESNNHSDSGSTDRPASSSNPFDSAS